MLRLVILPAMLISFATTIYYYYNYRVIEKPSLNYIITETAGPDSFDPLDADKTQNIAVMRMLYGSPLEINASNQLVSNVLEKFEYNPLTTTITFTAKKSIFYENGHAITPYDIAFAIARFAYYRPKFPVIKDIQGVEQWASEKKGLGRFPAGILVENLDIKIKLVRAHSNPLFRFCLEVFSIIPASCVDQSSGKLVCDLPPASGNFKIKKREGSMIVFSKRTIDPIEKIDYESITFKYESLSQLCENPISDDSVVAANEIDYLNLSCDVNLSNFNLAWMPSARFAILRFNPNVDPFKQNKNRQYFSEKVRERLREKNKNMLVERGLFSSLLPGYISSEDISHNFDDIDISNFANKEIKIPINAAPGFKHIYDSINDVANTLKMKVEYFKNTDANDLLAGFLANSMSVLVGASGFWAQDPVGDISMWFTPGLHKTMSFAWADKQIYSQLSEIESETDAIILTDKLKNFNRYISQQSVLVPIIHFRRVFITSINSKNYEIPQAVAAPAPWQIRVRNKWK